ncbi:uncharacterized protein LOC127834489 [Dreissena polymorpha]|uniref:Uncharacterized protein n=1 Tax=Dreissena polymorpha TaxID=45954 RepID=A0A9D4FX40_DREPO|nr:uncharacterized protein LOC127834489 [Dreissena polymorpha]KAH3804360.1 hypothetical protein DPMN_132644 [Dreissena polymorpha]
MMKALVIFVIVCVVNCSANPVAGNHSHVDEEAFKTNKIQMGDEELYIVTAADGTPLTTIDVFNDEGYEIELNPDGSKCRLSQVHDNSSCFEELPLADDEPISARISDRCKGREIVTLKPVDCDAKSSFKGEAAIREKRRVGPCRLTTYRTVCVTRCCFYRMCIVQVSVIIFWC